LRHGAKVVGFDFNPETSARLANSVAEHGFEDNFRSIVGSVAEEVDIKAAIELAIGTFEGFSWAPNMLRKL